MSIQAIREALAGLREKFGLSTFAELNVADLADLLVRLNEIEKVIIHRIEVALDERGERTTEVFVSPGVTVEDEIKPCPLCDGSGRERYEVMGKMTPQYRPCSRCGVSGTVPRNEVDG